LEDNAESAIDALGNVIVPPVVMVKPAVVVILPFIAKFPFNERSLPINTLPFKEASPATAKLLCMVADELTEIRPFNEISSLILKTLVVNVLITLF